MLEIVPMTLREANAFVEQNHRHHGPVVGHKFSIGISDGEKIVGVAIVGRPGVAPPGRWMDPGGKPPLHGWEPQRMFCALRSGVESGQGNGI